MMGKNYVYSVFALIVSVLLSSPGAFAATYTVDPAADDDCSDFVCDIQSALDAAGSNTEEDTINLGAGTYNPPSGGFQYSPSDDNPLTIEGAGTGQTILDGGGTNALLRIDTTLGTVSDANAHVTVRNITFQNGATTTDGGGLFVKTIDANITVENAEFVDSFAVNNGGGLYAQTTNGIVSFTNNSFDGNSALTSGGGVYTEFANSTLTLRNNAFTSNTAGNEGGGATARSTGGVTTFTNNSLSSNSAGNDGGGASINTSNGTVMLTKNSLNGNSAADAGGGVIVISGTSTATLTNNIFFGNSSQSNGGAVWIGTTSGTVTLTNNTLHGNSSNSAGGILVFLSDNSAISEIYNNIIWNNFALSSVADILLFDDINNDNIGSEINILNNDFSDFASVCQNIEGCSPNINEASNIDADPLFVDAAAGDFHIMLGSPCIDAGSSTAPSLPALDFDDNSRPQGLAPDVGADEFISVGGGGGGCSIATNQSLHFPIYTLIVFLFGMSNILRKFIRKI